MKRKQRGMLTRNQNISRAAQSQSGSAKQIQQMFSGSIIDLVDQSDINNPQASITPKQEGDQSMSQNANNIINIDVQTSTAVIMKPRKNNFELNQRKSRSFVEDNFISHEQISQNGGKISIKGSFSRQSTAKRGSNKIAKDQLFLASSMASAIEDVEKELNGRSKKGRRNLSGEKRLLSSVNSKMHLSGRNQGGIEVQYNNRDESDNDSINRPKQLESNREDAGAMMLMVMDSSASNHQDEMVPECPAALNNGAEEILSQPSLSTINMHQGPRPGVHEDSMLFTPKDRRPNDQVLILQSLQSNQRGSGQYLFAEPSEEINTQLLFQDHQVNNFMYHERIFTHRNINQFYINGQIQIPINYQLNSGQPHINFGTAGTLLHQIDSDNLPLEIKNSIISNSNANILSPLNFFRSTLGFRPVLGDNVGNSNYMQGSSRNLVFHQQDFHKINHGTSLHSRQPQPKMTQLQMTVNSATQGGLIPGSTNMATANNQKKGSIFFQSQINLPTVPVVTHINPADQSNYDTDNTDLNEEFIIQQDSPGFANPNHDIQTPQHMKEDSPGISSRGVVYDFSSDEDKNNNSSSHGSSSLQNISSLFQEALKNAPPYSVIKLPSHSHIQIHGVHIKHPIQIRGRPGTIIEIMSGNIVVDFREFLSQNQNETNQLSHQKVVISETSLIFKYELASVIERLDKGNFVDHQDYGLQYVTRQDECAQTIQFPMIVVEEQSSLEIRDCYMRSIRKDPNQPINQEDNLEIANNQIKKQYECHEIGVLTEPRSFIKLKTKSSSMFTEFEKIQKSQVFLRSCIFFNFYDQVKFGIDSFAVLEKCHMSEAKSTSVYSINPRYLKIVGCNFSKPQKQCCSIEWLQHSSNTEKCRTVVIEGCDLYASGGTSVIVQSLNEQTESLSDPPTPPSFSVHNLKLTFFNNTVHRSRGDGLTILNLALTILDISSCEFNQNQMHNIYVKQVHQKSNKSVTKNDSYLTIRDTKMWQSERGAGCWVVDTGLNYERCQFRGNRLGGLIVSGVIQSSGNQHLQARQSSNQQRNEEINKAMKVNSDILEVESKLHQFMRRFPMTTRIVDCEFSLNYSHGCWIDEHWKGPVFISQSRFSYNQESGLTAKADKFPKSIEFEHPPELDKKFKAMPKPLNKKNQVKPASTMSLRRFSTYGSCIKKSKYECCLWNLPAGTFHISECEFIENKHNGLNISSVVTSVTFSTFQGNTRYAIRLPNADQQLLLRLEYSSEKEYKRSVGGFVGGSWGIVDYKNAQKHKHTETKMQAIIGCCSVKHPRSAAATNSASNLVKGGKNVTQVSLDREQIQAQNMQQLIDQSDASNKTVLTQQKGGVPEIKTKKKRFLFF